MKTTPCLLSLVFLLCAAISYGQACDPNLNICDYGGEFIERGINYRDRLSKITDIAPEGLRNDPAVIDAFGGSVPDVLLSRSFLYFKDNADPNDEFLTINFDPDPKFLIFSCDCEEVCTENGEEIQKCEQTNVPMGEFGELTDLAQGYYYIVVFDDEELQINFSLVPEGVCPGDGERITCGTEIIDNFLNDNFFPIVESGSGEFIDIYEPCYSGDRDYDGEGDRLYNFEVTEESIVTITLDSEVPMGLFLFSYECGVDCITFAENTLEDGGIANIDSKALSPGTYYIIVDMIKGIDEEQGKFDLSLDCRPNPAFDPFFKTTPEDCQVLENASTAHTFTFTDLSGINIGQQVIKDDSKFFFFHKDGDELKKLDKVQMQWDSVNNRNDVTIFKNDLTDPDKCSYGEGEEILIKLFQNNTVSDIEPGFNSDPPENAPDGNFFKSEGRTWINSMSLIGRPNLLRVPITSKELPNAAGDFFVSISANGSWEILIDPSDNWMRANITRGSGTKRVKLTYETNEGDPRSTTATVLGPGNLKETILLTQRDLLGELPVTSIEDAKRTGKLTLFPNPTSSAVTLLAEDIRSTETFHLQLNSIKGERLLGLKGTVSTLNQRLNEKLPHLPRGLYLINIFSGEKNIALKLLKMDPQ